MLTFDVKDTTNPPPGMYKARFLGVEQITHETYGEGALFTWEIVDGDHAGKIAGRVSSPLATTSNATGKMIAGLIGGQFKPGQVSLEGCVGRSYLIQVGYGQDGKKTRVDSCMPTE
jgi:hypothetical protein